MSRSKGNLPGSYEREEAQNVLHYLKLAVKNQMEAEWMMSFLVELRTGKTATQAAWAAAYEWDLV